MGALSCTHLFTLQLTYLPAPEEDRGILFFFLGILMQVYWSQKWIDFYKLILYRTTLCHISVNQAFGWLCAVLQQSLNVLCPKCVILKHLFLFYFLSLFVSLCSFCLSVDQVQSECQVLVWPAKDENVHTHSTLKHFGLVLNAPTNALIGSACSCNLIFGLFWSYSLSAIRCFSSFFLLLDVYDRFLRESYLLWWSIW